jgi:protein gp37
MAARGLPGLNSPTTGHPFAVMTPEGPRWTGRVELIESALEIPLHWKKPRRIFVNSMSDLFHESLPFEDILKVYRVMQRAHWHTYQILTKRHARLLEFTRWLAGADDISAAEWPRQCWLGVSVENQQTKHRIDSLRQTPAALRFLSLEPLLEDLSELNLSGIGWVIVGGESGPSARPCNVAWIRSVVEQCEAAKVPCFTKQLGSFWARQQNANPEQSYPVDSKGGDPLAWPDDLCVRQFPEARP